VALFADRFLPLDSGSRHLDLATGRLVFVRRAAAGDRPERAEWLERSSRLAGVWHPHLATLVDYGFAGPAERFEVFHSCRSAPPLRRDVMRAIRSVLWFLGAAGLSSGAPSRDRIRDCAGRMVLLPDEWTGHDLNLLAPELVASWSRGWESLVGSRQEEDPRPFVPGIVLQRRQVISGVLDLLKQSASGRAAQVVVTGPIGSGLSTLSLQLAREARTIGFIPVASRAVAALPGRTRFEDVLRERFLFVLGDGRHDPDGRDKAAEELLLRGAASGGPSAFLLTIARVSSAAGAVAIDPISERMLTGMLQVYPPGRMARGRIAQAARAAAGRPGRLLKTLGLAQADEGDSAPVAQFSRAAESHPDYGRPSVVSFGLPAGRWEARAARGLSLAAAGRHGPAERLLREAAAGLRRHGGDVRAAHCTVALARLLLDRGRPREARQVLEATVAGDPENRLEMTTTIGICLIEEARLREAETVLRAACSIGDAAQEACRLGLARCLFWQARFDEAAEWIAPSVEAQRAAALRRRSAIELARHETATAGKLASAAIERSIAEADTRERARAHAAAIRALAGSGERDALLRHARDGLAAARAARAPLAALDVRLALGVATAADPGLDGARVWRSLDRLRRDRLPPLWLARFDALRAEALDDVRKRTAARVALAAFVRASGADALRPPADAAPRDVARVVTALLEVCQQAEDDDLALGRACVALRTRMRAAAVAIFGPLPLESRIASAGSFERGVEVVGRALTSGLPIGPAAGPVGIEAAVPIRYLGSVVGTLACRWGLDSSVEARALGSLLEPSAAALGSAVRAWLDRRVAPPPAAGEEAAIVTASPSMAELSRSVHRAAQAPFPVLIEGESGVGKELVARAVHRSSTRRGRRFVAVNCAALPDDLIEAELFGHARGAFTGAASERAGLFEEADGGTLFLDEVSELAPRAQAKLLRAIQDGEIRRVGENTPRRLDVRLVAASNRPLEAETASGRFRSDLLFRLAVIRLTVPPLRDRPADIHALAQQFWQSAAARTNCRAILDAETLAALARYEWPGNVRELQNVMSALAVHAPRRGRVGLSALPATIAAAVSARPPATLEEARQSFERQFVSSALARAGGHHARAAEALGVSRQGLAKLIKRLGLDQ
jgi:DNA-binding NtrC family response regulator